MKSKKQILFVLPAKRVNHAEMSNHPEIRKILESIFDEQNSKVKSYLKKYKHKKELFKIKRK